jgi:hypothetical protein
VTIDIVAPIKDWVAPIGIIVQGAMGDHSILYILRAHWALSPPSVPSLQHIIGTIGDGDVLRIVICQDDESGRWIAPYECIESELMWLADSAIDAGGIFAHNYTPTPASRVPFGRIGCPRIAYMRVIKGGRRNRRRGAITDPTTQDCNGATT